MDKFRQIGLSALVSASLFFAASAFGQTPASHHVSPFSPRVAATAPPVTPVSAPAAVAAPQAATPSAVKRVQVLSGKGAVEIEVEGSERLVPQTRVLTSPDRLVVDFPNATPVAQLRNQPVNRGQVKDLRVGLFHASPPVTRLVVDLKSPQSFQIFPDGKTVIIKVSGSPQKASDAPQGVEDFPAVPTRPGLVTTNYTPGAARVSTAPPPAPPMLDVTFRNGLLSIKSRTASLSQVLFAVHQSTGADITLSAGAEQEKVAADLGPAPAPEVLTRLLNGSKFNYMIVSSPNDPRVLDKVILSPKATGAVTPLPPMPADDMSDDDAPVAPPVARRVQPLGESMGPNAEAPPTNMPPTPHIPQPPPASQSPSTPPDDSNPN